MEVRGTGRRHATATSSRRASEGEGCQGGGRHLVARSGRDGRSGCGARGGWLGAARGGGLPSERGGPAPPLGWDRLKLATELPSRPRR